MAGFTRLPNRFVCTGLSLNAPQDILQPGKFGQLTNVRSYEEGTLEVRAGTQLLTTLPAPVHSEFRLNDATPFNGGRPAIRVFGASGDLYACPVTGPYPPALHTSGFSGNPLTGVAITPAGSAQPYLYLADSAKMGKMRVQGDFFSIGTPAPTTAPTSALQVLGTNIIEQFNPPGIQWGLVGGSAVGDIAFIFRVNTSIQAILYDTGSAPGYACLVPVLPDGISNSVLLSVGGAENIAVTETTIAVASTTIAAIIYDAGNTGLCTIQPVASLGTGQVTAPSINDVRTRYGLSYAVPIGSEIALPGEPATPGIVPNLTISQVDFPVNAVVQLGGGEYVRILSVAIGQDGVQSFRCATTGTHGIGESIQGFPAFRAWVNGTYGAAVTLQDYGLSISIFPTLPNPPVTGAIPQATGGIRTGTGWGPKNLAIINGRATLPGDDIHLSILATDFTAVNTVRVYFSMEPDASIGAAKPSTFTENYYFFEWRQSDIAAAIQAVNANPVQTIQDVRQTVTANQQLNQIATAQEQLREEFLNKPIFPGTTVQLSNGRSVTLTAQQLADAGANSDADATSQALALGNNQWIELTCKVSDLQRIGTETSTTLSNITAAEIIVNAINSNTQVEFDALWLSGGYNPDLTVGNPYVWSYRYRSSLTGARSNPSPPIRGGVIPRRQAIAIAGVSSSDPQVDLIDWFRLGGTLPTWTYDGTTPNNDPNFLATYGDAQILGGETLDFDVYQPWPSTGADSQGVVNVAGSAVQWVSGDPFNVNWIPGTQILINGQPYTLYAQPPNGNFLEIVENAGALAAAAYTIAKPTVIGGLQDTLSDDYNGVHFSVGDRANPGSLRWTTGNDPDATSLSNRLDVTTGSEPLMNVFLWDGVPFVWSSDNLYRVGDDPTGVSQFRAYVTPCGRGLWSKWAFCVTPQGVVFLAKDGLYLTNGGSPAISLSDPDLYRLFPHDGVDGVAVRGYNPPDMTRFANLRLTYVDGYVYFDYAAVPAVT